MIGAGAFALSFTGLNPLIALVAGGLAVMTVDNAWPPGVAAAPLALARPGGLSVLAEFAKLGVIVFGSGYVLLAFLRADLVDRLHWLTEAQLLDAVAIGQVTPGVNAGTTSFGMYTVTLGNGSFPFGAYTVPVIVVVALPEQVCC